MVGTRERTLRDGFLELYGRSPISYLKAYRLHEVRRRLKQAGPETRISDVAMRCGLLHLGRFAGDYRRAFGETPSATLLGGRTRTRD